MKTTLLILSLLATVSIAGPLDQGPQRATPWTAFDIAQSYRTNAIAADAKFKGQTIAVSGNVGEITATSINIGGYDGVECQMLPSELAKAAKLKAGSRAVIVGLCTGKQTYGNGVTMINCRFK